MFTMETGTSLSWLHTVLPCQLYAKKCKNFALIYVLEYFRMVYIWRKRIFRYLFSFTIITCLAWVYFSRTGLPHLEKTRSGPWFIGTSKTLATMKLIQRKTDDEIKRRMDYMRRMCNTNVAKRYSINFRSSLVIKNIYTFTPRERFTSKDVCFCKIPKSGSTFWGRALYMISHPEQADEIETYSGIEVHGKLSDKRAIPCTDSMINNSQSFMVTRNPWTRLYSAYIDKIYLEKYASLTAQLLTNENGLSPGKIDNKVIAENDCQSRIVSFERVLKEVISWASSRKGTIDRHFAPVSLLCEPCHYDYAFFMKQEHLEQETNMALDMMEVSGSLRNRLDMTQEQNFIKATVPNLVKTTMSVFASNNHSCLSKNDMYRRIWRVLQIKGLVSEELAFPNEVFDNQGSFVVIANALTDYVLENRLETDVAVKQTFKFLVKAYAQVNQDVLKDVQRIFEMDFMLFEYGVTPPGVKEGAQMLNHATALTNT